MKIKLAKVSLAQVFAVRAALHADRAVRAVHNGDGLDIDAGAVRAEVSVLTPAVQRFQARFGARVIFEVTPRSVGVTGPALPDKAPSMADCLVAVHPGFTLPGCRSSRKRADLAVLVVFGPAYGSRTQR